jgi:hypothetical protein
MHIRSLAAAALGVAAAMVVAAGPSAAQAQTRGGDLKVALPQLPTALDPVVLLQRDQE